MTTLVKDLESKSPNLRISIHKVDVGSSDDIDRMFQEIDEQHGHRPDILVSNAGYGKRVPNVWDCTLEEFDYTLQVNLRASFILVKGVVERMKSQRWGRIIFMSSIAAQGGGINGCRMCSLSSLHYITSELINILCRLRSFKRRSYRNDEKPLDTPRRIQYQC
jgi:3-oxoacyl-[acyl-carrier protein] reductase